MYTISTHVRTCNGISLIKTFHLSEQNIMAFDRGGSDNRRFTVLVLIIQNSNSLNGIIDIFPFLIH